MTRAAPRAPWLTIGFVAAAGVLSVWPEGVAALGYQRASGEVWRALSAQLVHDTPAMAALDLGVLALCGGWLERRARSLAACAGGLAVLGVAVTVHWLQPQVLHFAGSSGVAAALFTAAVLRLAATTRSYGVRALSLGVVAAALAKAALEQWAGLGAAGPHWVGGPPVLGAAHIAGSLAGLCVVALDRYGRAPSRGSRQAATAGALDHC
jgi:membrane associated rhomboid family serine protease